MKGIKLTVIGGGSSYTPELIDGIIKRKQELPISEICLVDIQEGVHKQNIIANLAERMLIHSGLDIKVTSSINRRESIKNADFVLTQFRVGGLRSREKDEVIPLSHGLIGQETTGAGGFAKALRTIPVILDICKDIEELAPNAWLINFTNPAGIITEAIIKHTKVKTIGLCNVPITMRNNIARILDVDNSRVKIDFIGLNHMIYGKDVYLDNEIVTDRVIKLLCDGANINMKNTPDLNWDVELLRSLKLIPCPYHKYFYMREKILKEELIAYSKGEGTRAKQVMEIEDKLFKIYENINLKEKPIELEKRGGANYSEAAISLISAIFNDKNEVHTVNVKNRGAISNLPREVVVEVNCIVNKLGAFPIVLGELPVEIVGLVSQVKTYEELTVEAGVKGDYKKGLMALINNPLVGDIEVSKKVFKDILNGNEEYLPQFKLEMNLNHR